MTYSKINVNKLEREGKQELEEADRQALNVKKENPERDNDTDFSTPQVPGRRPRLLP